jgi:hypothetical protein
LSSGVVRTARTDNNGVFSIAFANAEGDYWVNVSAVGFSARRFQVKRMGDEAVLNADVRLTRAVIVLNPVRVPGRRPVASRSDNADISGTELALAVLSGDLTQLGDLAALAGGLPGVTYIPGIDDGIGGFSIFGLDPGENVFLLNGILVDGNGIPRDAQMNLSINTSPYGAGGGGTGALILGSGSAGGNFVVRTLSFTGLTPQMQLFDQTARSLGQQRTWGSVGGRISGPLC